MQWAKPRVSSDRMSSSASQKIDIEVDLTGELTDDSVSMRTPETERQSAGPSRTRDADTAQWGSATEMTPQAADPNYAGDVTNQWLPGRDAEQRSAWDYYSRPEADGYTWPAQETGHRMTNDHPGYQYEEYEDDPYFGDMTPPESSQHNRSSWDADPSHAEQPGQATNWTQYVWPFIVVGFIVFLSFLTLVS